MPEQAVAQRRCASCDRWQGERQAGAGGQTVVIAADTVSGVCRGGPWDGNERRARMACGRWTQWLALQPSDS